MILKFLLLKNKWSRYCYYVQYKTKYYMKRSYFIFLLVVEYIEYGGNDCKYVYK